MKNNYKYLVPVFVLLFLISYFVLNNDMSSENESAYLIPELKSQINDVDNIVISKNEQVISLSKISGTWRIIEANNYLADANMIANLLLDLRKFKLKEKKTIKPDKYFRLSLDEHGDNAATQIKLRNAKQQFADVFIGKKAQKSQGVYVRKSNQAQTWLSEGSINVKLNPTDWIVSTILDISNSQVKSVSYDSGGQQFTIDKITPQDKDFGLVDMPENWKLRANSNLSDLANGLQKFNIESAKIRGNDIVEPILIITYQLFSGMRYHLKVSQVDQLYYLNIDLENVDSATYNNSQLENWTYLIANYKFDGLNKKLTDIIEPKVDETSLNTIRNLNE